MCTLFVALAALLVSSPSLRNLALDPFSHPSATALPADVASQRTATAAATLWTTLSQRPLHLPVLAPGSLCPVTRGRQIDPTYGPAAGTGPVYAVGIGIDGSIPYIDAAHWGGGIGADWGGQKVLWAIKGYRGPILVRGRQLDGSHSMMFNGGLDQRTYPGDLTTAPLLTELRLVGDEGFEPFDSPWTNWSSFVRMQTPGCFGMQIDGQTFTETVVFQAVSGV